MANTKEQQIGKLTVIIDRDLCIGSGACIRVAPEILELDSYDIVDFTEGAEDQQLGEEQVVEACQVCPVDALIVLDENDEQIVP